MVENVLEGSKDKEEDHEELSCSLDRKGVVGMGQSGGSEQCRRWSRSVGVGEMNRFGNGRCLTSVLR